MASSKLILLSLSVASTLMATAPAIAGEKSRVVRYSDLDLSSPAGRDRLQLRIKNAVKQVCGSAPAFTSKEREDLKNCETTAYRNASPQSARVIAAYMDKKRIAMSDTGAAGTN